MPETLAQDIASGTATAADTVLGVTAAGAVRRFAVGALTSFVSLKDPRFGLAYDGATDDTTALNAAFVTAAAAGYKLIGDAGQILVNSGTIKIPSGLYIEWEPGAEILHQYPITGTRGFIEQADLTAKISDVVWSGCTITGVDAATSKGNVFCLYGDDIRIFAPVIDGFGDPGRAFFLSGDRNLVFYPKVSNPFSGSGSGGIRVAGGDGFVCIGANVHSGDDCFQFVTGESAHAGFGDKDITNGTYVDCYGISDTARVVIAQVNDSSVSMSADLIGCSFTNCRGEARGAAHAIFLGAQTAYGNGHTGTIRNLSVNGGYYAQTSDSATSPAVELMGSPSGSTVVSSLSLVNVTVKPAGADVATVKISGPQTRPTIQGGEFYANTHATATSPTIKLHQGDDAIITGAIIHQGASQALRTPNAEARRALNLTFSGNTILNGAGTVLYDNYSTASVYSGNTIRKLSGGAAATGITFTANSLDGQSGGNKFPGIETKYLNSSSTAIVTDNDGTGTFTPAVTFATVGDLSVAYTTQAAIYSKANGIVSYRIELAFTPTYTTAAGVIRISGLPFTAKNDGTYVGGGAVVSQTSSLSYGTGYTVVTPVAVQNQTYLQLVANGSGKNTSALSVTQFTTGTAQSLSITGSYLSNT